MDIRRKNSMDWNMEETTKNKNKMDFSAKLILYIIIAIIISIVCIVGLLIYINYSRYDINVNGKIINTTSKQKLLMDIDETTYVNIKEFAKLVGYEYHQGEYKTFTTAEDKCYVQGKVETATFYLNDNKVCKLLVEALTEDYQEFTVDHTVKENNSMMYAPMDAIQIAFNVLIKEDTKSFTVYTLSNLVTQYDKKVKNWGYTGISDQDFENQKALLYGCLIVKKKDGLYKIIDTKNTKEIVSDRYTKIQFSEYTKEFAVTNSLNQVGIINLNGTTKIEPIYDDIRIIDKNNDLYLVEKDKMYGIAKSGNVLLVPTEYDEIGIKNTKTSAEMDRQYYILDTLIPVKKNQKWGALNQKGKEVINPIYDRFGCDSSKIEVDGIKKEVKPVLAIEECKGIVVQKDEKYGIIDVEGKELVPIAVDQIYAIENEASGELQYYMLYNGKELNIIERLNKTSGKENSNPSIEENSDIETENVMIVNINE